MTTRPALIRAIRRSDLIALVLNSVIGVGIFGLPSRAFARSGVYSIAVILACALMSALRALCYAEVGSRFEETGGIYLYARRAFGRLVGFEIGWLDWISTAAGAAAVCALLPDYLAFLWPAAGAGGGRAAVVTALLVTLTALNLIGIRPATTASNLFTAAKLLPLVGLAVVGLAFVHPARFSPGPAPSVGGFAQASILLLFAFSGYGSALVPTGEMREPRRIIPFALLVSLGVVTALYLAIQLVCIGTLPDLADSNRPLADAAAGIFGPAGGRVIAVGAVVSAVGALHTLVLATPRMLFAMAEQGDLPARLALVHPRSRVPHLATVLTSAVILAMALTRTFVYAATMSTVAQLLITIAASAALPTLRRRKGQPAARFIVRGGWLVAAAGIALSGWLLLHATAGQIRDLAIATLVGLLLYALRSPRRRPSGPTAADLPSDPDRLGQG